MALPALTWRELPTQVLTSGYTIYQMLDAIYTAYQSSTYINGVARTIGSGVAWTMSRYQNGANTEAVYGFPPTNTLTQQVIIAGTNVVKSPTPTIAPNNAAYTQNQLYVGINKNSGAFTSWNAALPFTSGSFSGYTCWSTIIAQNSSIRCFESQDGIFVAVNITGTGSPGQYLLAGGLIDPETGNTTLDAESDGKLYVVGNGYPVTSTSYDGGNSSSAGANQILFAHHYQFGSAVNANHFYAFTPGSATMLALQRQARAAPTGASYSTRSGLYARLPICLNFCDSTLNYTSPSATWAGRLREICFTKTAASGTTLRNSGTDVGYYLSDNAGTNANSIILSY
jgi:hypothetical protein